MSRPLHIIFLPSWYPVQDQPLNGIFNRELALLLSCEHKVTLLHLHFQPALDHIAVVRNAEGENFKETVVYLPASGNQLLRQWRYFSHFFKQIKMLIRDGGKPDLVHVQVAWKMGLMAWLLRLRFGIPFVITEHYTGYLPQDGALQGWKKQTSIFLLRRANAVTVVSESLKNAMAAMGFAKARVISNRLDDIFFQARIAEKKQKEKTTFIHVSNFDDRQKQTSHIIREFSRLHKAYPNTALMLLVPRKELANFLQTNKAVDMSGILHVQPNENRQVYAERMSQADALISFSKFETFGLTIAEALCLGVPVIYTACGGPEFFVEKEMGIEVNAYDANTLYAAMEKMVVACDFDREKIAARAREKMNSEKVIAAYNEVFNSILKN